MKITIDVPEWAQEYRDFEESAANLDEFLTLAIEKGLSTNEIARLYIIQRELGKADLDALPPNKTLLNNGGTHAINLAFQRVVKEVEIKGKNYKVRQVVAQVSDQDDDENESGRKWGYSQTPEALDSAVAYLLNVVPGHIMGRFLMILDCGGDVREWAGQLQDKIDEMVVDLEENGKLRAE